MLHKGEIRHVVLIICLVFLLAFICLGSEVYLNNSCQELIRALQAVDDPADLDGFDALFDSITDTWLFLLPHSEIDRLSEAYFHMYSAPEDAFEQEKQVLIHFLEMIPDRIRLSAQNVL
ncbi:MAG: hypothetical protein IKK58_04830 [Clostridia bacterium]|nr:hypothetical protein [Clostridia bacterium]